MKASAVIAAIVAVLAGALVFVFVEFQEGGERRGLRLGGPSKAEASCNDEATCLPKLTMVDRSGTVWTPESMAGKVVVVNVWATWCGPCKEEVPDLIRVYDQYRDKDVVLIGLLNDNVDEASLDRFLASYKVNYPVVRMDDDLFMAYGRGDALPTTYIFDKTGHRRLAKPGAIHEEQLVKTLDQLLAE